MIRLGETGIYFPRIAFSLIDDILLRTKKHIEGLRKHSDTPAIREQWHKSQNTGVNFCESPLQEGDLVPFVEPLGFRARRLNQFETGTVGSAIVFGSIREHNDQRTLGYSDLRTLFFPLSLPDGLAQFGTGKASSLEFTQPLKPGAAVCFDQNVEHHLLFDAQKALGTGVVIFVTRESYESLMFTLK